MLSQVELFNKLDEWRWKKADKVNVAIIGSKKSGKTTLALSLLGRELPDGYVTTQSCERLDYLPDFEGIMLNIHDTPGLETEHDPVTVLHGTHMKHDLACGAWIFTINMKASRFENNSSDIQLMENITHSFGKKVWNKATIVLTFANVIIRDLDHSGPKFEAKLKLWTNKIHESLHQRVNLSEEVASSVPVIAAGLHDKPLLLTDPEGMSWLNDIWLSLLLRSRCYVQPYIVKFLLNNLFKGPVTSGKQLINFMANHHLMYTKKAKEWKLEVEHVRAVKACSFLHALGSILQNHLATYPDKLSLCQTDEDNSLLSYWQNITPTIKILVVGAQQSGKTALVNSIFYGKKVIEESLVGDDSQSSLREKPIKHNDHELAIEIHDYSTIFNEKDSKFDILFYCIPKREFEQINPSYESNIRKFTDCFGRNVWKKTVVVVTFSNCLDSHSRYCFETQVKSRVETLQGFFQNYLGENVEIALAGYHSKVSISGDPDKGFWCIDLWMKAIPVAQTNSHPALITWLHTNTALHSTWKMDLKRSSPITSYYKNMLIDMLYSIVESHN